MEAAENETPTDEVLDSIIEETVVIMHPPLMMKKVC